jgi:hypothetical protein
MGLIWSRAGTHLIRSKYPSYWILNKNPQDQINADPEVIFQRVPLVRLTAVTDE